MIAVVGFAMLVSVVARAATFANPVIGFDEQFYLLVGDRILHGEWPFAGLFDRKPVGLFLIYAFARSLGGDGFLQYKLVALVFVAATGVVLYRIARHLASPIAAGTAMALYMLWLNLMEGEGGQSPVFYNLPMAAAAAIILSIRPGQGGIRIRGIAAMALVGLAMQIKYSVVVEGVFFGFWLIGLAWRAGERGSRLALSIAVWIAAALAPTLLAFSVFAAAGHGADFVFANFLSVLAQGRAPASVQLSGAGVILGILALPAALLAAGWRGRVRGVAVDRDLAFLVGWLCAAVAAVVGYWRFASPHYAMPLLPPLVCLLAPVLDAGRWRRIAGVAMVMVGLIAGQLVLAIGERQKGGAAAAAAVARAARPHGDGCLYVYDGYPALYMLTGSCVPTRWAFPGHLNTADEASAAALGVDPVAEVRRILVQRPPTIVDDFPRFAGGNPATHRLLQHALDAGYHLSACVPTGEGRVRLVYRRGPAPGPRPTGCPDDAALRRGRYPDQAAAGTLDMTRPA